MKKLLTITLTFCTFIVAMACGSNEPDVDGTTGATEQTGGDESQREDARHLFLSG